MYSKYRSIIFILAIGGLLALAVIVLASRPIRAAGPWYVQPDGNDGNSCLSPGPTNACATINGALAKADPSDTIYVATGTYTGTGSSEVVLLDKSVTLSGGWDGTFTTQSGTSAVDGEGSRRGMTVNSGVTAIVERFTVQNGSIGSGAGISNGGTLTLNNSTISDNTASPFNGQGGGIYNDGGTITLNNSIISGNSSWSGGGIYVTGMGTVTMNNSTVSGNAATGLGSDGGGIYKWRGTITLNNSTVSGNTPNGIRSPYVSEGIVTLNNSTVSDGISNTSGTMTLQNSIIANCGGTIGSSGYNLVEDTSGCTFASTTGDLINIDPKLGPLEGSPGYHPLLPGSPAINAGNPGGCMGSTGLLATDQRGFPRFGNCDIGAYEMQPIAFSAKTVNQSTALPGDPLTYTIALTNGGVTNLTNVRVTDTLPIALAYINNSLTATSGSYGYNSGVITWTGSVNAGGAVTITFGTTVSQAASGTTITNSAVISGGGEIITRTATVDVFQQVEDVAISGPATGFVQVGYPFTATVGPITATLPITYVWQATGQTLVTHPGGGLSDTVTFAWSTPGTQAITVTATNAGGTVTGTATVYIGDQVCLTKYTGNPVISVGPSGSWDDDDVWDPAVLKEGGSYKMWYTGDDGSNPSRIGLATSTNGANWTKEAGNPVLSPGASGAWDAEGIRAGDVISDGGEYKMWYTGFDSDGVGRIGYATSPDGVAWMKYGGNPVLGVGYSGSWEDEDVMEPTVIKEGSTYHMWYEGYGGMTSRIGHATSGNGIDWTKDPANPVLDVGSPGSWDWLYAYGPSVVAYGDVYLLWYSGGTLPPAWQTGYALSSDGSEWTREGMLIPEGLSGAFDSNSADYASVIVDGAEFKVWYSGLSAVGTYNIGYATAEICSVGAGLGNPIYLPIVMKGWNPAYPCPAYYTDDFADPSSGWPIDEDSNRKYAYTSGQYQILVKNPSQWWGATPGAKATDFAVAVNARRASGSSGGYGIQFGINEDWSEFYEVLIDANYYSIWRYEGSWTALRNWTTSDHINTGTSWNRLKVIRNGTSIALYVNDHHLATVTDGSFTGLRRIGLVAQSPSSGPLDARFDDFSLYPASCGVSAAEVGFEMEEPGIYGGSIPPELGRSP